MSDWLHDFFKSMDAPVVREKSKSKSNLPLTLMGSAIGWTCAFCLFLLYQSAVPHEPPVAFENTRVAGWADAYAATLVVSYTWQEIPREDANDVGVRSSIECKVDKYTQTFDLPILVGNYRLNKPKSVNRLAVYPCPVPVGSECHITTTLEWTPTLSVNKHTWTFPKSTFTVLVSPTLP